ncbi:cell wall protein DAN4-like [Rhagoletis pomonella]|uniref:cell wall protein DAN4-like n=1 Tax=Rhagoletis pomonella TaxID=28610 RepID=UPI0017803D27|nr:cell wall protein DAN4-like [Rhagoletis pomonella]
MALKVISLFFACYLQLLLHQQYPNLVAGESVESTTSSLPNNGSNIPIIKYQITNTPNVGKRLLQDVINGTTGKETGDKVQSRKITNTENVPKPTEMQDSLKGDIVAPGSSINSNQTGPNLVEIAPSIVVDMNTLQSNRSNSIKYNATKSDNITTGNQNYTNEGISINSTKSWNSTSVVNKTVTTTLAPAVAKNDVVAHIGNDSLEVRSTKSTITNTTTTTKIMPTTTKTKPTTTTTTTTPKPKKPSITFGLGDFPHLPGEPFVNNKKPESSSSKLPELSEPVVLPDAQPSQELNNGFNYHSSRDIIVPIMTVLFTIPLAIGVVITTYRRFRDCWSTRHYRRMDFLVDGMYND